MKLLEVCVDSLASARAAKRGERTGWNFAARWPWAA